MLDVFNTVARYFHRLATIFDEIVLRLVHLDRVERASGDVWFEDTPERPRQIFSRRNNATEEIYVFVEVPVVHFRDDMLFDNVTKQLQIKHVPRRRIRHTTHRNFEYVVMPMPPWIVALVVDALVVCITQQWVVEPM